MCDQLDIGKYHAARITRTEEIQLSRNLAHDQYKESGIVRGIDLIAEPDACVICLEVEAKNPHALDYAFEELHPNWRCAFAPSL